MGVNCVAKLEKISAGLNAIPVGLDFLFKNDHPANIFSISGNILNVYHQILDYTSAGCDSSLLENQLNPWSTQVDLQLQKEYNSPLADRVRTCFRSQEGNFSSEGMSERVVALYKLANCCMLNFPGYW